MLEPVWSVFTAFAVSLVALRPGLPGRDVQIANRGLLAPHVRRAVLIGRMIDLKTAEAVRLADVLDDFPAWFWRERDGSVVRIARGAIRAGPSGQTRCSGVRCAQGGACCAAAG